MHLNCNELSSKADKVSIAYLGPISSLITPIVSNTPTSLCKCGSLVFIIKFSTSSKPYENKCRMVCCQTMVFVVLSVNTLIYPLYKLSDTEFGQLQCLW